MKHKELQSLVWYVDLHTQKDRLIDVGLNWLEYFLLLLLLLVDQGISTRNTTAGLGVHI